MSLWWRNRLALALLVARVLADHHDLAVATNHLALVTDWLNAWVDLHECSLFAVLVPAGWWAVTSECLLVAVDNTSASEVVWAQLYNHAILREDSDVVLAHLA